MTVRIHIDNENGFSEEDKKVISALNDALNGTAAGKSPIGEVSAPPATPAKKAVAAPAKKAAAAPPKDEEPAAGEDLGATAVELATAAVAAQKAKEVKALLNDRGVKRVTELPEDELEGFIDEVRALLA